MKQRAMSEEQKHISANLGAAYKTRVNFEFLANNYKLI